MLYSMTFAISTEPNTILEKSSSSSASIAINESYFIAPIAVGFIVIAMVYAFGHISGAHFNPVWFGIILYSHSFYPTDSLVAYSMFHDSGHHSRSMDSWIYHSHRCWTLYLDATFGFI